MSISYVILHYKNLNDTIKCIESLLRTTNNDSNLIVVDNGSGDGSGEKLKKKYQDMPQIKVLLLENNVGFSKGNNAGYIYVKKNYDSDFIVVTNNDVVFYQKNFEETIKIFLIKNNIIIGNNNNDVVFYQKNFEETIKKIYAQSQFYVLGPDVYIPRHKDHQNPLFKTPINKQQLINEIKEYKYYRKNPLKFEKRLKIHALKNRLCSKYKVINFLYSTLRGKDVLDYKKRYENVGLQGSCLIFSKKFIMKEDKAFEPEPFLYEEETFLFYRCQKKSYKMVYDPSIAIRHEEAASFTNANKDNIQRLKFMLNHHVKAREELLKYLEKEEL